MKHVSINHPIEKHILGILTQQKTARFRDMRPPGYDTNLYSYHLTKLVKNGYVKKTGANYMLDRAGFVFIGNAETGSGTDGLRTQVALMFVVQNSDGDTLLVHRQEQPFIDTWTLPGGMLGANDSTIQAAAKRLAKENLKLPGQDVYHAGDCYLRVRRESTLITNTLIHVFTFNRDDIMMTDALCWVQPHKLPTFGLAPGIDQIIARTFFRDPFFFEEFDAKW